MWARPRFWPRIHSKQERGMPAGLMCLALWRAHPARPQSQLLHLFLQPSSAWCRSLCSLAVAHQKRHAVVSLALFQTTNTSPQKQGSLCGFTVQCVVAHQKHHAAVVLAAPPRPPAHLDVLAAADPPAQEGGSQRFSFGAITKRAAPPPDETGCIRRCRSTCSHWQGSPMAFPRTESAPAQAAV